jgi:Ca2+-binding RTX toxin-like protein
MTATIRVQPGETVTCTWTNTRRGAIVVRKQSIGGIGTFTYTADNGVTVPNVVTSATANPKSSSPITVDPGTYHVTEAVPSGWDLTGLSCDDGGDSTGSSATATINIQPGETVTCTWVNTKRGTITIRKTSVFGTSTFNYAADNGLTVPDITTTTAGTPKAAPALPVLPGTYHVTESPKTDWTLTDLSCDDADSTESIPTRTATILVAPGENVTCTYENTRTRKADLALAITLPASAGTGLPFTAGLVVTNNGPDVSPGFTVTANLGANVVAGALPAGCLAGGGNTVTCTSTPNLLIGPANAKTFNLTLKNQVTGAACSIWGTAGNDNMTGTGGNDVMCGLGGDDTLNGGGGDDTIYGDIPSGVGNYGTSVSGNVTGPLVDLVPANNSASANTTITLGTPDGDHLTGGGNSDTIFGQEGNDIVTGDVTAVTDTTSGTGDALLDGGVGSDKVYGQGGVDVIQGGPNNDTLNGGAAADTIFGSTGDDNLDGDVGDDDLRGGDNDDIMHGDFGNDTMNGGEGADSMYGDDGNDEISGSDGNDLMFGQGGNDVMNGGEGNDNMTGNNGADAMNGNNGNDTMNGNDGNDTMNGSDGVDTMNGGNDNDTINGNDHNDEIHGNDGRDFLEGGGGTDRVFGDTGNDALHGGTANAGQLNFLDGGTGTDCASAGPDTRTRIEAVNACTAPPP